MHKISKHKSVVFSTCCYQYEYIILGTKIFFNEKKIKIKKWIV